ncbi:MAG: metal-dependent hydrolase [Candidatus Hydrothermarchaeales archaeon]
MPDWVTHVIIAFFVAKALRFDKPSLVMLGGLLPDLVTKSGMILRYYLPSTTVDSLEAFHTPVGSILICLSIAPFFKEKYNKTALYLGIGSMSHLFLDSLQRYSGVMFFWPFSWAQYSSSLFWSEDLRPLVISLVFVAFYITLKTRKNVAPSGKQRL